MQPYSDSTSSRPSYLSLVDIALSDRKDLLSALDAACKENPSLGRIEYVNKFQKALAEGISTESFLADPSLVYWLPLVLAERTDEHDTRLVILAQQLRSIEHRVRLNWYAFVYPMVLLSLVLMVLVTLSVTVIPTFIKMFREFGLKLPAPTIMVFGFANFVSGYPFQFALVILLFLVAALLCIRFSRLLIQYLETVKVVGLFTAGSKSNLAAMARFTDTLSAAIRVGFPPEDAIEVAGIASGRFQYRLRAAQLAQELRNGVEVPRGSRVAHNFPSIVLTAASVGAQGQPNIRTLDHVAALYRAGSNSPSSWIQQAFAPLVIMSLGGLVGFIIIALFMPLVSVITSLSGSR